MVADAKRKEVTRMLRWYKVDSKSEEALRNTVKSLKEQKLLVRPQNGHALACISDAHMNWFTNVCKDFGVTPFLLDKTPTGLTTPKKEEYIAPCGEKLYDHKLASQHRRLCPKCRLIRGAPAKPGLVAKLEPGQELSLDGVIASLEVTRDQLWEKVESLDSLLVNLKGYRDGKEKLSELTAEVGQRVEAVRLLMRDGKF